MMNRNDTPKARLKDKNYERKIENKNSNDNKNKEKSNSTKKKKIFDFTGIVIFIIGFLIFSYPFLSNFFYEIKSNNEIETFLVEKNKITSEEVNKRIELAKIYNQTLDPSKLVDPYKDKVLEAKKTYARMLEVHEQIGFLEIPKLELNLPIYAGTSDSVLSMGLGHMEGTSLPIGGEGTHSVITGHRGLPKAKLFTDLDKMEKGDIFYIHNLEGVLAYQVDQILVVEPSNFNPVLVEKGKDYTTLLTCTPYMVNSHRLLVRGKRIEYTPPKDELNTTRISTVTPYKKYFRYLVIIISFVIMLIIFIVYKMRKYKNKI